MPREVLLTITMDSWEAERLLRLARAGLKVEWSVSSEQVVDAFAAEVRSAQEPVPSRLGPGPWHDGPPT